MDTLISQNSIIENIIKLMEQVEQVLDMSGLSKKTFVMKELKILIGNEAYVKYYFFIQSFIEFTVQISKNKIKLNLNNIKKKYCCF